mmetsp:Transcript_14489/g.24727  ORF Transcript_14489/g.24727 Transcript_14489/m.24727 type:complete len:91 (-) Transcript_14489:727-999(-)
MQNEETEGAEAGRPSHSRDHSLSDPSLPRGLQCRRQEVPLLTRSGGEHPHVDKCRTYRQTYRSADRRAHDRADRRAYDRTDRRAHDRADR